jgi:hypothetical protein
MQRLDSTASGLLGLAHNASVDNLIGLLGGGMNRIDSESQFQEFLKRIPSTKELGSLAAAAAEPTASVAAAGIPRVPSLDYIRQLVSSSAAAAPPPSAAPISGPPPVIAPVAIKPEMQTSVSPAPALRLPETVPDFLKAATAASAPSMLSAPMALPLQSAMALGYLAPGGIAALQDLALTGGGLQVVPAGLANMTPAAGAAVALQLGTLTAASARVGTNSGTGSGGSDKDEKVDARRQRRCASSLERPMQVPT